MDTGVRDILVKALNQSAAKYRLQGEWQKHFPKAWDTRVYSYGTRHGMIDITVSPALLNCIESLYTPAEILSILAVARFEGIWSPE